MTFQITKITPLEKRPCAPEHAFSRGLSENYETVLVLQGVTDGHLHAPIEWQGNFYKPFARHDDPNLAPSPIDVTVLLDDPGKPYKGGDLSKYEGTTALYEKCVQVERVKLAKPVKIGNRLELFAERQLILHQQVGSGSAVRLMHLKGVLAWKSGMADGTTRATPFAVKAVQLSQKEMAQHAKHKARHERIPL